MPARAPFMVDEAVWATFDRPRVIQLIEQSTKRWRSESMHCRQMRSRRTINLDTTPVEVAQETSSRIAGSAKLEAQMRAEAERAALEA